MSLILYCWPLKHQAIDGSQSTPDSLLRGAIDTVRTPLLGSAEAAAAFLDSKALDHSKLQIQESKGDKITAASIKRGELPEQSFEDTLQQDGLDVNAKESQESSPVSVHDLRPGECGGGICRNGSISEADFVFAVATHQNNEPTLMAGRAGRLVSPNRSMTYFSISAMNQIVDQA